jgi:hypothetical protein
MSIERGIAHLPEVAAERRPDEEEHAAHIAADARVFQLS